MLYPSGLPDPLFGKSLLVIALGRAGYVTGCIIDRVFGRTNCQYFIAIGQAGIIDT